MSPKSSAESRPALANDAGVDVLLVGPSGAPILENLAAALERDGWRTAHLGAAHDLAARVGPHRKAVVVVLAPSAAAALELLERLETKRHSVLVIVLVDRAEPGEYYCLMQAGAIEYFEVSEDPVRILQGVEWAAHVLAP